LTPLHFLLWGFVKEIVYHEKVQNMIDLCDRFVRAAGLVTNEISAITHHLDVCHAINGAYIEIY
jgi:hypothetical protein